MSGDGAPLVSVIMGAFDCASTLCASIDSILGQDYRNLELIVCDDGSSDGTADAIDGYARADGRVRLLRNERNLGLPRTLNRCAAEARGEYLARMDGDDLSLPDRISKQVAYLEAHPDVDICGSSIALFDGTGVWGAVDYPEDPKASDFLLRSPFAHPTVVFRAEALRASGGYGVDPSIGRSEDYELFMRMYAAGRRGHNIQEYLLEYREELGSLRRRKYRYALTEVKVRLRGFRSLGLLPRGLPYVIKPLIVGLAPKRAYAAARKAIFGKGDGDR